ncbi:MAG: VCBS repeat-containing protein, partial [Planctomycetales bacterium]|nr:VCBS repeat-containing protein [Planctomycetales bacterium]
DAALDALPHTPWFSMGCDLGDLNNDGLIDFIASDMAGSSHYREKLTSGDMEDDAWFLETAEPRQYMRNAVYLNTGCDRMMEAGYLTGLTSTDWTWSIKLEDFDQDGRVDVYVTNGMNRDWENSDLHREALKRGPPNSPGYDAYWKDLGRLEERNLAFRNQGDLRFEEVGATWGLDLEGVTYGAATGDLDGDGDLDLIVNNMDAPPAIYRNTRAQGRSIRIRLRGRGANPWGVGATLYVHASTGVQTRYLTPVRGFMSGDDPTVHFGLGDAEQVDSLIVQWADGRRDVFNHLEVDRFYTIVEGDDAPSPPPASPPPLFTSVDRLSRVRHREKPFDELARQPLLPRPLSRLGPGVALGDLDNDGRDDVFLTSGNGTSCQMLQPNDDGEFEETALFPPWGDDAAAESLGVALLDVEGDGDLDVYVVNGGVEFGADDERLADRLYLNDGHGEFSAAPKGSLPDDRQSGGCVAAADFDRDGDVDLFIGGRCVPDAYPQLPASRLLVNDNGILRDASDDEAAAASTPGMATAAVWSDANNDGWLDLLVAYDWGPIRLFLNRQGRLEEASREAGLADLSGWWNGLTAADVDNDGDVDYIATNFGLNSRYQPTQQTPVRLFRHDWEGGGRKVLIEASTDSDGRLLPTRGRGALARMIPSIEVICPTYESYARATLHDLFDDDDLQLAESQSATTLSTGVFVNDGGARFQFIPLPHIAQAAPAFGAAVLDVDGDGFCDLFLAQNLRGVQREAGDMNGGVGLLLTGRGDGRFEPVWPNRSGILLPHESRSVAIGDVNDDGRPDLLVGVNSEPMAVYAREPSDQVRYLSIRLLGPSGNPQAIGARLEVRMQSGRSRFFECPGGGGYLTHSSNQIFCAVPLDDAVREIVARWPDGSETRRQGEPILAEGLRIQIAAE